MVKLFSTKLWKNGLQRFPSDVKMSENLITVKSCRKKTKKTSEMSKKFLLKTSVVRCNQAFSSFFRQDKNFQVSKSNPNCSFVN